MASQATWRPKFAAMVCVSLLTLAGGSVCAEDSIRNFNIPSQPAKTAVNLFAEQTGYQILAKSGDLEGVTTQSVVGNYTADEAVHRLLKGTTLSAQIRDGGLVLLSRTTVPPKSLQPSREDEPPELTLVVTGFRKSLDTSINVKRSFASVADVITAADLGEFPDANMAESLQHVTGIQITRSKGEGQYVSIRGLDPKFGRVLFSGRTMSSVNSVDPSDPSQMSSRAFDFSDISSEFIGSLEVIKSPTADLEEGGISGTINIKSIRPLSSGAKRLTFTAESIYESNSGRLGPHFTALFVGDKDHRIGWVLGADYSKRYVQAQRFVAFGMEFKSEASHTPVVDYNFDGDSLDDYRYSHVYGLGVDEGVRERKSYIAALQVRPTEHLELRAEVYLTDFTNDLVLRQMSVQYHLTGAPVAPGVNPIVATHVSSVLPLASDFGTNGQPIDGILDMLDRDGARGSNNSRQFASHDLSDNYSVGMHFNGAKFTIDAELAKSLSTRLSDGLSLSVFSRVSAKEDFRTDPTGIPSLTYMRGYDDLDPTNHLSSGIDGVLGQQKKDSATEARVDFTYNFRPSGLTKIWIGAKATDRRLYQGNRHISVPAEHVAKLLGVPVITVDGTTFFSAAPFMTPVGGKGFMANYSGGSSFPKTWLSSDTIAVLNKISLSRLEADTPAFSQLTNVYAVDEHSSAAYFRADFNLLHGDLTGNFGVRVVTTDQFSSGYAPDLTRITQEQSNNSTFVPSAGAILVKRRYSEALPSLNLKYRLKDKFFIRFAAARTITRPDLADLSPRTTVAAPSGSISTGNPYLNPYSAFQYDLSTEWYFTKEGLVSTAVFLKDVDGLTLQPAATTTLPVALTQGGVLTGVIIQVPFTQTMPVNAAKVHLQGLEFNYQQPFDFPAPFDGFGIVFNYTYVNSSKVRLFAGGAPLPLTGVSPSSFNLVTYYEKSGLSVRLTFNHRDGYVEDALSSRRDGSYVKAYDELDASARIALSPQVSITLEGSNLLNSPIRHVNEYGFTRGYELNGRRIVTGFKVKF